MSQKRQIQRRYRKNNISIVVKAAAISSTIAGFVVALFYFVNGKIVDTEFVKFVVSIFGTVATLTSAFYIGSGLHETALSRKRDRTVAMISAWNNSHYTSLRGSVLRPIGAKLAAINDPLIRETTALNYLQENPECEEGLITILNFLEEVSLYVNEDLADYEIAKSYFGSIIPRIATTFNSFIEHRRTHNNNLYDELVFLASTWGRL
jgi:hypothetical protein